MKHKKILFNSLLFQYRKFSRKLKNLSEKNANFRKQEILSRRIQKLQANLLFLKNAILKTTSVAAISGATFLLNPSETKAQTFLPAEVNPYSIIGSDQPYSYFIYGNSFADLDNDGDLDMMLSSRTGFLYYKNEGTSLSPDFAAPALNPFSLTTQIGEIPIYDIQFSFVDIDADGDFDIMAGSRNYGNFYYFQNTGDSVNPSFSVPVENPFELNSYIGIIYNYGTSATFADLDEDGDLDMFSDTKLSSGGSFLYFQNTGTTTSPTFAIGVINPFTIEQPAGFYVNSISLGDLDKDGDFDILGTDYYNYYAAFVYWENTGNSVSPSFAPMQVNPFSIGDNLPYITNLTATFADLDGDGDLDVMAGTYGIYDAETYTYNLAMFYFENASCIPTVVSTQLNVLSADSVAGSTYQWLDCTNAFATIAGETNTTFSPTAIGSYALQVVTSGGCTDTSSCYDFTLVGLEENLLNNKVQLFPNPAQNTINLVLEKQITNANITIQNITGQVIFKRNNATGINFVIDVSNQTKGFYFIEISENGDATRTKFAKE